MEIDLKSIQWDKLTFEEFQNLEKKLQENYKVKNKKPVERHCKDKVPVKLDNTVYLIKRNDYLKLKQFKNKTAFTRYKNYLKIKYEQLSDL